MMIHGRDCFLVNGKYYPKPKVTLANNGKASNGKVDRIASFARTPSNYGDMAIPAGKLRQSRSVANPNF